MISQLMRFACFHLLFDLILSPSHLVVELRERLFQQEGLAILDWIQYSNKLVPILHLQKCSRKKRIKHLIEGEHWTRSRITFVTTITPLGWRICLIHLQKLHKLYILFCNKLPFFVDLIYHTHPLILLILLIMLEIYKDFGFLFLSYFWL